MASSGALVLAPAPVRSAAGRTQVGRSVAVGAVTTAAYLLLYAALEPHVGEQVANALALVATASANTSGNRRLSFELRGREGAVRHHMQGLVIFGVCWVLTSGPRSRPRG